MVGDSTMSPHPNDNFDNWDVVREGWGQRLQSYLVGGATVVNLAVSGRTSRNFITQSAANHRRLLDEMGAGDYLFIQFGHNDQRAPDIALEGDRLTAGSFQYYLYAHFVRPALDADARPVLFSPVVRRRFAGGVFSTEPELVAYGEAARALATALDLPFIDLNALTAELYRSRGADGTVEFHALPRGGGVGSLDNTHFSGIGAHYVAGEVVDGILLSDHVGLGGFPSLVAAARPERPTLATPDRPALEPRDWEDGDKVWGFNNGANNDYFFSVWGFEHGFIGNGTGGIQTGSATYAGPPARVFANRLALGGAPQMWFDRDGNTVEGALAPQADGRYLPAARSFRFRVAGPSEITVFANHTGSAGEERFLYITNDATRQAVRILTVDGNTVRRGAFTYDGAEPATFHVYSRASGINILTIEATNVTGPAE